MHRTPHPVARLVATALIGLAATAGALAAPPIWTDADMKSRLDAAKADPKRMEAALALGAKVAGFCANCHGPGGNSAQATTPNLAGQNANYLVKQMSLFAQGKRRYEFMEGMIKALSADEAAGVVLFYTQQPVHAQASADPALAARGKAYYDRVCFRCHGAQGMGSDQFARIAGQQPVYLRQTLQRYRDGNGARIDPLMAANTRQMTDADIAAVVAYVSSMR